MTVRLNARARLMCSSGSEDARKAQIDQGIDRLQKQIDNLRKSVPSVNNRVSMGQRNRIVQQKQILRLQERIADERLKKVQMTKTK